MASNAQTYVRTVFGIIEMVLFSGVIFGWANMVLILKEEKYFADLCAENKRTLNTSKLDATEEATGESVKCGPQDERLALIFTLSVFAFNVAGFVGGALLDKLGTRFVRFIACFFLFLTGVFAFLLEKERANLLFPLIICLALAGMFIAITLFQIAVLHQKFQFVVSSSFSGGLDSSSVVFLIFKTVYDKGVELRWILLGYVIVAIVYVLLNTFFLLPKTSIAAEQEEISEKKRTVELGVSNQAIGSEDSGEMKKEPVEDLAKIEEAKPELGLSNEAVTPDTVEDQEIDITENNDDVDNTDKQCVTENGHSMQTSKSKVETAVPEENDKFASGWRYILTGNYLWLLYFFSVIQLRLWFFVGSLNSYLIYYTADDKGKIETYSESFGLAQFFGFLFAPFTGLVMNLQPRCIRNPFFGPTLSWLITLLLCLVLGGLVLIPVLEVQYLAFVVQVALRAFLYASLISFILRAFPAVHYGKLYGVCTLVGATISLLQYPAVVLIDGPSDGNPYWVNFGFFMATFTAAGFPIYMWRSNRDTSETTSF